MPYIKQEERETPTDLIPTHPGELNYAITTLALQYLEQKGLNYGNLNEVIGVLECAKLELYRRVAVPYENKKIAENGDLPLYVELTRGGLPHLL